MPASQFRDEEGRDLRGIRKGLIVEGRQPWDHGLRLLWSHIQFGVIGPQVLRDRAGVVSLVIDCLMKADCECLDRAFALCLHQGNDGGGINPPREKRPQRHIGDHSKLDSVS